MSLSHLKNITGKLLVVCLVILLVDSSAITGQSFFQYKKDGELNLHFGMGISKYFGEMSEDRKLGDFNPHLTAGITLPFRPKLSFRGEVSFYQISAADADLPEEDFRRRRNLSFKSSNWEAVAMAVYHLNHRDARPSKPLRPYIAVGVGLTYFNPKAQLNGIWYELQPLFTEGINYDRFNVVIPMVVGLGYRLDHQTILALELSYRFTFTDYLDDVSQDYRNPLTFTNPIAAALADRRPEIGLPPEIPGNPRGNDSNNDGYLFLGVKVFYKFQGKGPVRRRR